MKLTGNPKKRGLRLGLLLLGLLFSISQAPAAPAHARAWELDGQMQYLPLVFHRFTPGTGSLEGQVFDATTDAPIPGAKLCAGEICVTTDEDGRYRFDSLWAGSRLIDASHGDFFPRTQGVTILPDETVEMDFTLADKLLGQNAALRILVTWNDTKIFMPSALSNDLDSHLWVTNQTQGTTHIYADPSPSTEPDTDGDCTMFPNACQVNDDMDGYGPETTDFRLLEPNTMYYFGILNVNQGFAPDVPPMIQSGARVEVYDQDGMVMEFSVPLKGQGDFWYVFSMDANGVITPAQGRQGCITWYPGDRIPTCP